MASGGADVAAGGDEAVWGQEEETDDELWAEYLAHLKAEEDKNRLRTEEGLNLLNEKRMQQQAKDDTLLNRMRVHRNVSFNKDQVGLNLEGSEERALTGVIEQLRATMKASATDWKACFRESSGAVTDTDGNKGIKLSEFERVLRESVGLYVVQRACRRTVRGRNSTHGCHHFNIVLPMASTIKGCH